MSAGTPNRRAPLLGGCALALAMAALAHATPAAAQIDPNKSFQGIGTSTGAFIEQNGTNDVITVTAPQVIIDWAPIDTGPGPIVFLPAGRTATFQNSSSTSDFVVLNRIVPTDTTRGIRFDGTVRSQITDVTTGATATGGSVWFYSPGGIIAGSTALFDVGNLVLTTNPIDTNGGLFGPGGEIRFGQAINPGATVDLNVGARINALTPGSYVAIVAPRIVQAGTVNVDGSTAYVGAEAATIRINGGLFDIAITTGTTGTAIEHSGTTTGPANSAGTSRIYMTTIAKNDAVSMLLSGTIGYTPASSAFVDNGTVVLAAGYNVTSGEIDANPATGNSGPADIIINTPSFFGTTFSSDVVARASNALTSTISSVVNFTSDADLHGDNSASITVPGFGQRLLVGGNLTLSSGRVGQGGTVALTTTLETGYGAAPGIINVGGNLTLDASATGAINFTPGGTGGDAIGGTATIDIEGGSLTVGGSMGVLASGAGGYGVERSGNGTGGTARFVLGADGTVNIGSLTLDASGYSNDFDVQGPGQTIVGGDGTGRLAELVIAGGDFSATSVTIGATGNGGSGGGPTFDAPAATGGNGQGGTARLTMTDGTASLGFVELDAGGSAGFGGDNGMGGNATGGTAAISVTGAALSTQDGQVLRAGAFAGDGISGGDAIGGTASITVGVGGSFEGTGFTGLNTSVSGGSGRNTGGQATGGQSTISVTGGSFLLGDLDMSANADGGRSGTQGGVANGGDVLITALDGGSITSSSSFSILSAMARGGAADSGGNGTGGSITLDAAGGGILFDPQGTVSLQAGGSGGRSLVSNPTTGQGGTIAIIGRAGASGTSALVFGNLNASTDGMVGFGEAGRGGMAGTGGLGLGGTVTTTLSSGTLDAATYSLSATGVGGQSTPGGVAGDGEGGYVTFDQTGGTATIGTLDVSAIGVGGDGAFGDSDFAATAGGTGFGGDATISVRSINGTATLTTSNISIDASGNGGNGGFAFFGDGGAGGIGRGGNAQFITTDGAVATGFQLDTTANGVGGAGSSVFYSIDDPANDLGGNGGDGFGGDTRVTLAGSGVQFSIVGSMANGTGGNGGDLESSNGTFDPVSTGRGGNGGTGTGGNAQLLINGNSGVPGYIGVHANGDGGFAGSGPAGGNGGAGAGGSATLTALDAVVTLSNPQIFARGAGANGADGVIHDGGNGGAATGGSARVVTTGVTTALSMFGYFIDANASGGQGGAGGFDTTGGLGGNGGSATGGTAELVAQMGTMTLAVGEGGVNSLYAVGVGGGGGTGGNGDSAGGTGGNGGNGTGGTARVSAIGGTINAPNFLAVSEGQAGLGGLGGLDDASAPATNGTDGFGAGGLATLVAQDGPSGQLGGIRFANTTMRAGGLDGQGATAGRAGRVTIDDSGTDPAGSIRLASLIALAQGDTTDANSGFFLTSATGPVVVTQAMEVRTNGPIAIAAQGSGGLQVGGALSLFGDESITISHAGQPGSGAPFDTIRAASLVAQTDGNFLASPGSVIRTDGAMAITAGGAITGTGALLTAGTSFDATAGRDLTFSRIRAGTGATLRADNGVVRVTEDLVAADGVNAFGLVIDLTAVGPLQVNQALSTSGDIRLTSQTDALTLGFVNARGGVFANAGTVLRVGSSVIGNTIDLASADVELGSNAQVGEYDRTTAVTFTNNGTATSYIGGTGSGSTPGYRLSDAELQQVTTRGDLFIRSPNDVVLDTLSLAAFRNFGPDGRFTIDTSGNIDIIGAATFTRLGDDNTIALNAEGDIRLAAETGSVALDDGDGALGGVLELNAGSIIAASSAAQADINGGTMAAIDTRLGTNDGSPNDAGYFRANSIRATVSQAFYVQNSGTNSDSRDDRRGVTVGSGGLEIASTSSAPIRVVVNGRQQEADGSFTTGVPFLQKVRFTSGTTFDSGSTANGCQFSKAPDCDAPDVPEIIPEIDAVRDVIDSLIESEDETDGPNGGSIFPSALIQIVDFTPTSLEPVVDEPVTGSGNEDLWLGEGAKPQGN